MMAIYPIRDDRVDEPTKLTTAYIDLMREAAEALGETLTDQSVIAHLIHFLAHDTGRVVDLDGLLDVHADAIGWFADCVKVHTDARIADIEAEWSGTAHDDRG
jgi:hypothetical protein